MSRLIPIGARIVGFVLVVYLAYESAVSLRKYRRMQQAIAGGDSAARARFYGEILRFEFISAGLAIVALQFDLARLTPARLGIADTAFGQWLNSTWQHMDSSFLAGLGGGAIASAVAVIIAMRRARNRPAQSSPTPSRWRRILPDFGALIPTTPRERVLFVLVALSAGVAEEVVYRAWLLDALHGIAGLAGVTLVVTAAVLFGLGHYYQGIPGMLVTSLIGFVFCGLYIATGSLVMPMVVHALIDLRVAVLPSPAPLKGSP